MGLSASAIIGVNLNVSSTPGVIITQTGGSTNVSESGVTDSYSVVLNSQPTANVTIAVNNGNQTTTNPVVLTFTPQNWNVAQNVTVRAVDDTVREGSHSAVIQHTATSSDVKYNNITIASVNVSITDNDGGLSAGGTINVIVNVNGTPGVTINQTGGSTNVTEGGATDIYSVVLNSQPTANVSITINNGNQTTTNPTTLTFTSQNWNVAQNVTVVAVDDLLVEGNHSGIIQHTATSSDAKYNNIAITAVNVSITDNDIPLVKGIDNDIFTIKGTTNKAILKATLTNSSPNLDVVNELGVFTVDDAQGRINGIAPGDAGYTQAALDRAKVILSGTNVPDSFDSSLQRLLEFNSGDNLRFYLVKNNSTDSVWGGITPTTEVLFSSPSNLKITNLGTNGFSLAWEDGLGNNLNDFQDLVVNIQATNEPLLLGTKLQGSAQGEVIDLRGFASQVKADFVVYREAIYNSYVSFYQVTSENGGIDTNSDGTTDILPGQVGYTQAAVNKRVAGIDLAVNTDLGTATFTSNLLPGFIYAPFIIVNGRPDAVIDSNSGNDPVVYFPYLGANPDKIDHIRLLGDNILGFEDLPKGIAHDFNDLVVKFNLSMN